MRDIDRIILHHTAGTWGNVESIDHAHRQRGWDEIGYHYLVLNGWSESAVYHPEDDGRVEIGRPLTLVGAHDRGENETSIGIALVGYDVPTWPQMESLHTLVQGLRARFRSAVSVYGHSENEPEGTATACPGERLRPNLDRLREWLQAPRPDPVPAWLAAALAPRRSPVAGGRG